MDDASYNRLMGMFPGDMVDEVRDDDIEWPSPSRLRRPVQPVRHPLERPKPVAPEVAAKFRRLMEAPSPAPSPITTPITTAPSATVPARQYLLEAKTNVTRWLEEARDIESDVKLGQAAEPHRVTRLMLEAIPVVQKFHEGA
jgi:hypothetical protein